MAPGEISFAEMQSSPWFQAVKASQWGVAQTWSHLPAADDQLLLLPS